MLKCGISGTRMSPFMQGFLVNSAMVVRFPSEILDMLPKPPF